MTAPVDAWFSGGRRLAYDAATRSMGSGPLRVFVRPEGDVSNTVTFLPGYPDGSYGWSRVAAHLSPDMPRLFFDYVGMGDSDKPRDYRYSTVERADLVEALWEHLGVRSTILVTFDFSSLVVLEHLRRRLDRAARGERITGPQIRGVFIFNGGLFTDGHSHPWYTTPLLRRLPRRAWGGLGRSFATFKRSVRVVWSKRYPLSDEEIRDLFSILQRHDGAFYLAAAAGFVAEHRAQGSRLDFGALYAAYHGQFPILVGGSSDDPFEHRQVDLAETRLGPGGPQIVRLPGGHLTTSEYPRELAGLITSFAQEALAPGAAPPA